MFKLKCNILSGCAIVEDSLNQNKLYTETHKNKIEVDTDNNSKNNINLKEQNENIKLLEKLAKQINDLDKDFPICYNEKFKMNKLEINNKINYETKQFINNDEINDSYDSLNKSITFLASKFVKLENVPADGNCGIHTLVKILNNEQININFKQIIDLLKLTNIKLQYG